MIRLAALLFSLLALPSVLCSQDTSDGVLVQPGKLQGETVTVASGIVTGKILCADTNTPARFSRVFLKPVVPVKASESFLSTLNEESLKSGQKLSAEDAAIRKQARAAAEKMMDRIVENMISTSTGADGSYTFTNVPAGTYYVHATVPGYIDPVTDFTSDDLRSNDAAVKDKVAAAHLVSVTLSGPETARADLRIDRGAAIAGRVTYDDGSPATGWTVRTVRPPTPEAAPDAGLGAMGLDASDVDFAHLTETSPVDDAGHFRIAGLSTGSYYLRASYVGPVQGTSMLNPIATNAGSRFGRSSVANMIGLRLNVYSGGAASLSAARPVEVRAGEERREIDMIVPLQKLHSLSGRVIAASDAHPINSGSVEATGKDADGKDDPWLHFTAGLSADGTFHLDYLPSATYTVKVSHAQDATTISTKKVFGSLVAEQKTERSYGDARAVIVLHDDDRNDVLLQLPAAEK